MIHSQRFEENVAFYETITINFESRGVAKYFLRGVSAGEENC
jgi:hypothetical protein